jgi:predicted peroxiredoxin
MNDQIVIVASCGTDNPNRATRAIQLATVAQKEGKKAFLFLLDDAVYLAKKGLIQNLRAATGDIAEDLMTHLQEFNVPIIVCTPCAKARQINEKDLIEGARFGTGAELIDLACNSAVISL